MRVLGIDPGTAIVGWGILDVEGSRFQHLASGHIATKSTLTISERISEISHDLREIILRYTPNEASVEKIFFFKNQKTIISVSEARGAILLTLETLGIKLFEYTPLQVKQSLTGYGRADKKQMQAMVKTILKLSSTPKPDDVADALALAICHTNSRSYRSIIHSQ